MLRKLRVGNFRAIGDPIEVDLKPITLLFGPNGSGKSSILQAMLYAHEVVVKGNADAESLEPGGDVVDLGGFHTLVHRRDASREVQLGLLLDPVLLRPPMPFAIGDDGLVGHELYVQSLPLMDATSAWIGVGCSSEQGQARPSRYELTLGGQVVGRIVLHSGHAFLLTPPDLCTAVARYRDPNSQEWDLGTVWRWLSPLSHTFKGALREAVRIGDWDAFPLTTRGGNPIPAVSALPDWSSGVSVPVPSVPSDEYDWINDWLTILFAGSRTDLSEALAALRYVGPLRRIPPRNFQPLTTGDVGRWANGLAAWDLLWQGGPELVAGLNRWLGPGGLDTGFSVRCDHLRLLPEDGHILSGLLASRRRRLPARESMAREASAAEMRRRVVLRDERRGLDLAHHDAPVGISQMLPVMVAALAPGKAHVLLEQPELHLHPAWQVRMADLLIEQLKDGTKQFLVETHSEHLLLRLLRRIRETTADTLPPGASPLTPDQLAVYWVESSSAGLDVRALRVDSSGEFLDRWPRGFFGERAEELFH